MIKYKVYRNTHCSLIRYTKFFNDSLNNMKKTWKGINDILSRNSKNTNPIQFLKTPITIIQYQATRKELLPSLTNIFLQ